MKDQLESLGFPVEAEAEAGREGQAGDRPVAALTAPSLNAAVLSVPNPAVGRRPWDTGTHERPPLRTGFAPLHPPRSCPGSAVSPLGLAQAAPVLSFSVPALTPLPQGLDLLYLPH